MLKKLIVVIVKLVTVAVIFWLLVSMLVLIPFLDRIDKVFMQIPVGMKYPGTEFLPNSYHCKNVIYNDIPNDWKIWFRISTDNKNNYRDIVIKKCSPFSFTLNFDHLSFYLVFNDEIVVNKIPTYE